MLMRCARRIPQNPNGAGMIQRVRWRSSLAHSQGPARGVVERKLLLRVVNAMLLEKDARTEPNRSGTTPIRRRARTALAVVVAVAICAGALQAGYLIFASAVLPSRLKWEVRQAGAELTFEELRSSHPARIVLMAPDVRGPAAWAFHARELDVQLAGYLPFGDRWRINRCSVEEMFIQRGTASAGPLLATVVAPFEASAGQIEVRGAETRVRLDGWSSVLELEMRARLDAWSEHGARVGTGVVSLVSARPDVRAHFHLDGASFDAPRTFSAFGRLVATGSDAGVLLDIAAAGEAARWMLSELAGQPFEIEARIDARDGSIHMRDVRLETGSMQARGALRSDAGTTRGTFVVQRGRASLAVQISNAGISAQLAPQSN